MQPAMQPGMQRVAILSGGGSLPMILADSIKRGGGDAHIVAVRGEADPRIESYPHTWVTWGSVNAILSALKRESDGTMMIAGSVSRPDLLHLQPDFGVIRHLPKVLSMLKGGDDAVLTRLVRFFESQGLTVKGVGDIAPELLAVPGILGGQIHASADAISGIDSDTEFGLAVLDELADLDIGQAIVVERGRILAIEGVEGTDRMLARVAALPGRSALTGATRAPARAASGVVVKAPKRGQELRVDLPTVGAGTIGRLAEANLAALVITAGKTLLIDQVEMVQRAVAGGIEIRCIVRDTSSSTTPPRSDKVSARTWTGTMLGRHAPSAADSRDARTAAEITQRLRGSHCGRAAVVVRDHVLAVAAAEGPVAMAQRITALRQWGRGRFRHGTGAAAFAFDPSCSHPAELTAMLEALDGAGLAGVAVVQSSAAGSRTGAADVPAAAVATADRLGLFLVDIAASAPPPAAGAA